MRFRQCVGTLLLVGLVAACGSPTQGGGFHPNGTPSSDGAAASAGSSSPGSAAGGSGAVDANPGVGTPSPKTPQAALAAYRAYQRAYEQAYENNDASVLRSVVMDPLLTAIAKDIASVRAEGFIWRFHNVVNPRIQGGSRDGSTVVILDCVRTLGSYRFSAKTGERVGTWRGDTAVYQAIMRYSANIWKISDATQGGKC